MKSLAGRLSQIIVKMIRVRRAVKISQTLSSTRQIPISIRLNPFLLVVEHAITLIVMVRINRVRNVKILAGRLSLIFAKLIPLIQFVRTKKIIARTIQMIQHANWIHGSQFPITA